MFDKPSRVIPKNYRNITGKFSSKKSDRLISYESKLERDFLYVFELNNIVLKIVEQPLTIEYYIDNKLHRYTPDFYLKTPFGYDDIVVEVKYYNELKKTISESKQKYKAMVEHLKNKDTRFFIYTDRCQYIKSEEYQFNTHFLLNYNSIEDEHLQIIRKLFYPYITIEQLLNLYSDNQYKQFSLIRTLWCMIRRNILRVDLFKKLTVKTKLLELKNYDNQVYQAYLDGKIPQGYLL